MAIEIISQLPITNYQMALSKQGAGGGSATHKEPTYDYDYDYIMAPQRGRPYGANLGSMGRNTGTWSINLGSNGILKFLSKLKQWLPPAHPKSLASQCMSGQPISTCHALTS